MTKSNVDTLQAFDKAAGGFADLLMFRPLQVANIRRAAEMGDQWAQLTMGRFSTWFAQAQQQRATVTPMLCVICGHAFTLLGSDHPGAMVILQPFASDEKAMVAGICVDCARQKDE